MPVTRVLDANGNVLHDCTVLGCYVSWDGYALQDQTTPTPGAVLTTVKAGTQLPGAATPNPSLWKVNGNVAQAVAPAVNPNPGKAAA